MQGSRSNSDSVTPFIISVGMAFVLSMLSVADYFYYFWPDWVVLTLIFWCFVEPNRYGPLTGFVLGILLDVLTVKTFGVLSLGLVLIAFLVNKSSHQLKVMTPWQQALLIGLLLVILKFVTGWIYGLVDDFSFTWTFWYSIIGSMLAWPFVFIAFSELRQLARNR